MSSSSHTTDEPREAPDLGITTLHHVGISTLDIDRLLGFYVDTFGFEQVAGLSWDAGSADIDAALALDDSSARMVMLRLGDIHLELFEFSNPRPVPVDAQHPVADVGINHLCLVVDDLDVVVRRLEEKDVVVHSTPRDVGDGPFVYCRDPDGNAVEFWQVQPTNSEEAT
jgi:catechol 2,3-dioxygenase-like lactoylglutathione lyase family enzyme